MKRPLCLLCLLFMGFLLIAEGMGILPIWGNPLPEEVKTFLKKNPQVTLCGEAETSREADDSRILILKDAYLIRHSTKISLQKVQVILDENIPVPCGAVLLLSGNIREIAPPTNPGEFDRRSYYAARQIFYTLEDAELLRVSDSYDAFRQGMVSFRSNLSEAVRLTAGEYAAPFSAMVLGDKTGLDEETNILYRMTGIMHLFALSSLHIGILGMTLYNVLMAAGAGIWPSALSSLFLVIPYAVMTGGSFSAIRAVAMFLMAMIARITGRVYDPLTALATAAILMLTESPACLYDSGFLMSFAAVLGVSLMSPTLQRIIGKNKTRSRRKKIRIAPARLLLSSLGVQIFMMPVSLWFYGEVSLVGIFLNLLILPTAAVVLVSAFLAAATGCIGLYLGGTAAPFGNFLIMMGKTCAFPGQQLLKLYDALSRLAGSLPFCTWIPGRPALWQCAVFYLLMMAVIFYADKRRFRKIMEKCRRRRSKAAARLFPVVLLAAAVTILSLRDHSLLQICFLDVGVALPMFGMCT